MISRQLPLLPIPVVVATCTARLLARSAVSRCHDPVTPAEVVAALVDALRPDIGLAWFQAIAAVLAPLATAAVAIYALRHQAQVAKHQWLQEQRRVAYVDFLYSTRKAYDAIAGRNWDVVPTANAAARTTPDQHQPQVEQHLNNAKQAAAVVRIVGPDELAQASTAILARLRLDRLLYSPTREEQLVTRRDRVIALAEETGDDALTSEVRSALESDPPDVAAYERAHTRHRLDHYWDRFARRSNEVLRG
jgi:hypothetical protein